MATRKRQFPRGSTAERGYGTDHQRDRRYWKAIVDGGLTRCARGRHCLHAVGGLGGLIDPAKKWDLGHPDHQSSGGPEHRDCNRGAPNRRRRKKLGSREW